MWNSGFFNALLKDGVYDRKYNADDYSNALSIIVGNGVVNALDGTSFKVEFAGNATAIAYALKIKAGWAWINGKWVHNDIDDTTSDIGDYALNNIAMCTKNYKRIDRLFLRRDDSIEKRAFYPVLRKSEEMQGTVSGVPTPIRTGDIFEICIAEIHLDYTGDSPTVTVYDKRADANLCGWVNGYFGDNWEQYCATITQVVNNYIANKTDEFNNWFGDVRNEVASVTLLKPITNTVTVGQSGATFSIGIAEYDPALDILEVYTNGLYEKKDEDYTIDADSKAVIFTYAKAAGAVIDFVVTKAVDGRFYNEPDTSLVADVETRIDTIEGELETRQDTIEQFTYFATGENDNIKLCQKVKEFISEDLTDRRMIRINVISTDHDFVITQPYYTGAQSGLETYNRYFDFSYDGITYRRFILDFANCSPITIAIPNNTNNIIFYGSNQQIHNCVLKAGSTTNTGTKIVGVYGSLDVHFVNCKIGLTCSTSIEFAYHGIYDNCEITLTSTSGNATAFYPSDGNIVEVNGGIYFLYTTQTAINNGYGTKFIYHSLKDGSSTTALSICRDVSVPNYARTGYVQDGALYQTVGGYLRSENVIAPSARTKSISNTDNVVSGAIALSRAKGQAPFI